MQAANAAPTKSLSDVEFALRVARGDQEAFRQLVRRHNRMLCRAARSILKDDAEAEDALQEAYLRAFRAIADFRGESKLSTWLVRIVVNEALECLRKRARAARAFPIAHHAEDLDAIEQQSECAPEQPEQPERAAQRAQTRELLEAKIDLLPDAFRTVFTLRGLEELSITETAAALDIPEATVRTRFFRARSKLREALSNSERPRAAPEPDALRWRFSSKAERGIDVKKRAAYIRKQEHTHLASAPYLSESPQRADNPAVIQGVPYGD